MMACKKNIKIDTGYFPTRLVSDRALKSFDRSYVIANRNWSTYTKPI